VTYQDGFETLAIHAGQEPDPVTGAVVPPIYQVSTYKQDGVGGLRGGYEYSRSANPTRTALERCLAALESGTRGGSGPPPQAARPAGSSPPEPAGARGGTEPAGPRGLAFASGMAAEDCLIRTVCSPGDHVLIPDDAYGGTYRLFARVFAGWGLSHGVVPIADLAAVREQFAARRTAMLWVETPTNPLLNIADIRALASAAHEAGVLLVVDNTFASPYLQQPLTLGADVVVHSTTKYLGGHSDVVGGALVVADGELAERLAFTQNATGGVAGPFDAWLTLRGIKTLAPRMDRHCRNAMRVAQMLAEHPAVAEVRYPGLPSHPGHKTAQEQMRAFGGMVSFRLLAGEEAAVRTCGRTRLFTLGESLGGVESLIEHPGRMTHASVTGSALEVPGDLIRLSVGIEDCDDLLDDLRQALSD
jgi:cystathionine gamma-synthase